MAYQPIPPTNEPTFRGRASTFRSPGRAGTAGQKIFVLFNGAASGRVVKINQMTVDLVGTVIKAVTVLPPVIRFVRCVAAPTNGTVLTKVSKDTSLTSAATVVATGDASADGTASGSALTVTTSGVVSQEFAPRLITAVGYEVADRMVFLDGDVQVTLRPGEGIVAQLDYVLATQNPVTDMWLVTCDWSEFLP